jgi:SRSO17 transposase
MLPDSRVQDDPYQIPKFDLKRTDLADFKEELKGFHSEFQDCFSRQEPRDNFYQYMVGQMSPLERKSIEPIAIAVESAKVRAMQFFVSDVVWDNDKIMSKYRSMVNDDMGDQDGALIFDESSFVKKGVESAGVAKQYCDSIGKVENCQVGVFAAYATRHGYCLLDSRLYVPEKWFSEEFTLRRDKCKFPSDIHFKTKPQLAVEMLQEISQQETIPFRYVVADSIYGDNPDFIGAVENLPQVTYLVSLPADTLCWIRKPIVLHKQYRYKGELRSKQLLKTPGQQPISFETIAKNTNNYFWYRRKVSEGTKGPIEYEFTKKRVVLSKKSGLPEKEVWLLIRRTLGDEPIYSYFICNALVTCRLKLLVWLSGIRWAIEQCFEEAKTEIGMDHYEVRKFPGWVHHIMTCILAHFFLWHIKLRLGKKSTSAYAISA